MLERSSSPSNLVHLPTENRVYETPKEQGKPDREVTPVAKGGAGKTDYRGRRGDQVNLSRRSLRRAVESGGAPRGSSRDVARPKGTDSEARGLSALFRDRGSIEEKQDRPTTGEAGVPEDQRTTTDRATPSEKRPAGEEQAATGRLDEDERAQVSKLQERDAEVRQHEQAHAGAGGSLAGAPQYEYEQGPDGRSYAVGGEVPIDLRKGSEPKETVRNAQQVRRAALAPAKPSAQDRKVAQAASRMEREAEVEAGDRLAEAEVVQREETRAEEVEPASGEESGELLVDSGIDLVEARRARDETARRATDAYERAVERRGRRADRRSGSLSLLA